MPATLDSAVAVEFASVERTFGGVRALHDVSFRLPVGLINAVIGPNGAGKTTAFNLVSGLMAPTAGRIEVLGTAVQGMRADRIAALGVSRTFQIPQLIPDVVPIENVLVGLNVLACTGFFYNGFRWIARARQESRLRDEAAACMEAVGISPADRRLTAELPFGQQRLVELARALASKPSLLLVDEPASGLSEREVSVLAELIFSQKREGRTVVLVEHNMALVMEVADRVVVLDHGSKIFEGEPTTAQTNEEVLAAYLGSRARSA